jgi:hypothetical protein
MFYGLSRLILFFFFFFFFPFFFLASYHFALRCKDCLAAAYRPAHSTNNKFPKKRKRRKKKSRHVLKLALTQCSQRRTQTNQKKKKGMKYIW